MIIGNILAILCIGAFVVWLVAFFAYWKGRSDGTLEERKRWTSTLREL
jgi:hypothetical protein